ncbi:hypothetical protein PG985_004367 [Apiospora marii]|uniref:uncharacterized protein n=1 Tax=Apiospora marii TaxID=335849 RepID=UPI00312EFC2D
MHPILDNPNQPDLRLTDMSPPEVFRISEADLTSLYHNTTAPPPSYGPAPSPQKRYTIGPDDRVRIDDRNYPFSAMGRLTNPKSICSASLIGPRHVAAARHCWAPDVPYYFAPAFNGAEVFPGAYVTEVLMPAEPLPDCPCCENADWAIFVLDKRLGESNGFLGADALHDDSLKQKPLFYDYGYPGDLDGASRPYRQQSISVYKETRCDATGPLDTDADGSQGMSGGPLWLLENGDRWQYGVMARLWFFDGVFTWSTFAGGEGWVGGVVHARETWP